METIQHVVILSGGLDSSTILASVANKFSRKNVNAVHFFYGQRHQREKESAQKIAEYYNIHLHHIDLSGTFSAIKGNALTDIENVEVPEGHYTDPSMQITVVPFRNLIFISSAAALAASIGATNIYMGVHSGDHPIYPDCRPAFIHAAQEVLRLGHYESIKLKTPFVNKSKGEILEIGMKLKVPYELTWTCYKGEAEPCGKCGACVERAEAFKENGAEDPILI